LNGLMMAVICFMFKVLEINRWVGIQARNLLVIG